MCIIKESEKITVTVEYQGYYYKLSHVIKIMLLGLLCRNQTMKDIQYWATSKDVSEMLKENFGIKKIPCYSHFTNIVGIDIPKQTSPRTDFICTLYLYS